MRQQVVLLATALVLGAIGLFYSALLKRTQAATVLTYITVLALTIGTVMIFIFWTVVMNRDADGGFAPGVPDRAPEQLMYVNPGIAMLDVVGNTEPGGFGGINSMLAQLRGEEPVGGGGVQCQGNVCQPVDQFGNPIDGALETGSGYWWPRITITYVILAILLTLGAIRFIVPPGMRWAFRRSRRPAQPAGAGDPSLEGAPMIQELREEPDP